ncbi:hypothetical protein ACIRH0_41420 [Streptomyces sp. NPDC093675]|uniref:hypothetical protein n=1 Tax=Streptomyces sp. NPDC093675 TaxID=3366049 RepID=UPI003801D756
MTEPAPITASSLVRVDYHTFELTDSDTRTPTGFDTSNGLVFSVPGQAMICTGISNGWVNVSVQVCWHPPAQVDANAWEEIVEHSVETATGALRVTSVMSDAPELPLLTPQGSGTYRIRVHARGRDTAPDGAVFEPVEDYLLIVWPAESQPDEIHKQTDRYGTELRAQPSRPAPPPPESDAEDDIRRRQRQRLQRRRTS